MLDDVAAREHHNPPCVQHLTRLINHMMKNPHEIAMMMIIYPSFVRWKVTDSPLCVKCAQHTAKRKTKLSKETLRQIAKMIRP
jgi:hypothetical protein